MMNPESGEISEAQVALREMIMKKGGDPSRLHENMRMSEIQALRKELNMEDWPILQIGEEIEIKGHKFKLKHIDTKHNQIVLVSSQLKRVL